MSKIKGDPGYRAGWCIHYRSPSQGLFKPDLLTCEAGVEWSQFRSAHWPCFLDKEGNSRPGAAHCDKLRRPTPEEIAAHKTWQNAYMDKFRIIGSAVTEWRTRNKGRSHSEVIECPACKGRLHLSIAAYNGHVHGHCETDGCVRWME